MLQLILTLGQFIDTKTKRPLLIRISLIFAIARLVYRYLWTLGYQILSDIFIKQVVFSSYWV